MADFDALYAADRLPLPQVRVGSLVKSSFFSTAKPTRIPDRAIALAQHGRETKSRNWQNAA